VIGVPCPALLNAEFWFLIPDVALSAPQVVGTESVKPGFRLVAAIWFAHAVTVGSRAVFVG
jgi:hypothetical protein